MTYQTPYYRYDAAIIRARSGEVASAFKGQKVSLHYAIKANDNPAVIALVAQAGIGACLVSSNEMRRAMAGGIRPADMLMNGVGKSDADIRFALENGIGQLNVESLPELEHIAKIAADMNVTATICLRINPEITAKAHTHTVTARREDKFGLLIEELDAARAIIDTSPSLNWVGFSCHIGSQIEGTEALEESYRVMADLFRKERAARPAFDRLDLGGGFGVSYKGGSYARPDAYAKVIGDITKDLQDAGVKIQLEPGRFVVAESGTLVTKVLYVKHSGGTRFVIVDAAMNNLIRPALYGAYHPVSLARKSDAALKPATIVGPVCESADVFGRDRDLPDDIAAGDILHIGYAGAYGAVMSCQYNARSLLQEVLVDGDTERTIRKPLTAQQMDELTL